MITISEYICRYKFYGYVLWNILNHISLPLIMFYRFHASVCLVDIWRHSYEPAPLEHWLYSSIVENFYTELYKYEIKFIRLL